jgi:aldose 1-epimerase
VSIDAEPWGRAPDGQPVALWTLRHDDGPIARIATWGATLVSLAVPLAGGGRRDVVLGFDTLAPYLGDHPYIGAAVGRWANRIADGRFVLDGVEHRLARNAGAHHLHGGERGLSRRTWHASAGENTDGPWLQMTVTSPDGEDGFPGTLQVSLRYGLHAGQLRLDWTAVADRPTPVCLTHHAYFNLAGGGDVRGHRLRILADRFLPVDAGLIPTGELRDVTGTPMDFRDPAPLGERLDAPDPQVRIAGGLDHCWVLADAPGPLRSAAELHAPDAALVLRMATTEPGLQVYTGNGLDGSLAGRGGARWPRHGAVCLEAERFPDSPNRPAFPDAILRPGATWRQTTVYGFD